MNGCNGSAFTTPEPLPSVGTLWTSSPNSPGFRFDRVNRWLRAGVLEPVETVYGIQQFDFWQITAAKRLDELARVGISLVRLRRSLQELTAWLPEAERWITRLAFLSERQIVVRADDGTLHETSGQRLLDFEDTEIAPAVPYDVPEKNADDHFAAAHALEQGGQWKDAEAAYRKYLRQFGPDPDVCFNLANVLWELGRHEAAIERYQQVVELAPDYQQAWSNLGTALAYVGRNDEALQASRQALSLNPTCPDALYTVADSLDQSGSTAEARNFWKSYLRRSAEGPLADHARQRLIAIGAVHMFESRARAAD